MLLSFELLKVLDLGRSERSFRLAESVADAIVFLRCC